MTQPIQEPTTDRALQGFAFARDQIFRRPAPQSGFTPTVFRARQITGGFQTLGSSGAETDLEWNVWENGDDSVFDPALVAGKVRSVTLLEQGVYSMVCMISVQLLNGAVTAGTQLVIVMNDGYDNPSIVVHPKQFAGSGGDYMYSDMRTYIPFLDVDNPPGVADISFDAAQNGGTNRDTQYGTMMEIVYFGPFISEEVS